MNKFSAGILLMVSIVFIGINELGKASVLLLFDAKKKEPFGGGEPRQDLCEGKNVTHIDFYTINYSSG